MLTLRTVATILLAITLILLTAPGAHAKDLKVVAACPDSVSVGGQFNITITATNNNIYSDRVANVTRGVIGGHLGNLSVLGPVSFPASTTIQANGGTATFGPFTFIMPSVGTSTFVSVGVALLGKWGTKTRRDVLGADACHIEVTP